VTSSSQSPSLDNHLNESLLTEDEGIDTHHTADIYVNVLHWANVFDYIQVNFDYFLLIKLHFFRFR